MEEKGDSEEKTDFIVKDGESGGQKTDVTKDKDRPKRCCWAVIGLLTVVTFVELLALLVVTVRWRDTREEALKRREACLPWGHLDDLEGACRGELEAKGGSCCGDVSRLIDALVERYSEKKFIDSASARMLAERCDHQTPDSTPIAMMSGLAMQRIHQQVSGEGTAIFWDQASPRTILKGVRYLDGALIINTTGHYYVYSQIKVKKNQDVPTGSARSMADRPFFSHYLFHHSLDKGSKRTVLLESSNSDCDISSSDNEMSSSFGAVFKLEAGDKLYVETSHPQNLDDSPESSFFGLYSV